MTRRELLAAPIAACAAAAPSRPNVVVILADDLAFGDLSCYGGQIPTPHLDRFAAQGIRFTQGYVAAPICSPSRVGIMTGQCPSRHLIFSYLNDRASQARLGMRNWLDPQVPNIARTFQSAGYATAHFGKWHMGGGRDVGDAPLPRDYGIDESLVSFEGLGDRILPPGRLSDLSAALGRGNIRRVKKHEQTAIYVDRSLDFISQHGSQPFYLNLWLNDIHDPFQPEPSQAAPYIAQSKDKYAPLFRAVLEEMDRQMGRFFDGLEKSGRARDTIVVFLGDNGPTAWPYYYKEGFPPPGSTAGLRGRKWSLYEGGIREPFLVRWPGHTPAGKVDQRTVVSAIDLFPTLTRMAGIAAPKAAFDGEDLSRAFLGKPTDRKKDLFWEYGRAATGYPYPGLEEDKSPNLALRSGRWKLLCNDDGSRRELYDLAASDKERDEVSARHPKVADQLATRLLRWRRALPQL